MKCVISIDMQNGIGMSNRIPWHIPLDLKRFRELTSNSTLLMGSNTFFSLPINKRPLPGNDRKSIVITRRPFDAKFDPYRSFENLHITTWYDLRVDDNMTVIGGADIFDLFFNEITTLYLTVVRSTYPCDRFLKFNWNDWIIVERQSFVDHEYYVLHKKL